MELICEPLCSKCGAPLLAGSEECLACSQHRFTFNAVRSWGRYAGELRQAILVLKHRRNGMLGSSLAQGLMRVLQAQDWKVDALAPIPLAQQRRAERGFNQVDLLARPLSIWTGIRWLPAALERLRETELQMALTVAQRWENVHNSFKADPQQVGGLNVLVIDDIMTTGATLDAAACSLWTAGAKAVYGLTLARTLLVDPIEVR